MCQPRGQVKTSRTMCFEILREILRESRLFDETREFRILASQQVIDLFLEDESQSLAMLSDFVGKPGTLPDSGRFVEFPDGLEAGYFPAPTYPREARLRGESGTTRLRWVVKASGEVTDIQVVTPSGSAALDRAAVSALRNQWRFQPGQVRRYEQQFEFKLVE